MHVHSIRVSFTRKKRPADYEEIQPTIELAASLDEDDDAAAVGIQMMGDACTTVYAGIGMAVPERIAEKLGLGEAPEGAQVATTAAQPAAEPVKPKTTRKPRRTKAEIEAAKTAEAATKTAAAEERGNISTNPENRVDPENSDIPDETETAAEKPAAKATEASSDIPSEEEIETPAAKADDDMSAADLQGIINKSVTDKVLSIAQVKELLKKYGVARTSEIKPEDRAKVQAEIEAARK